MDSKLDLSLYVGSPGKSKKNGQSPIKKLTKNTGSIVINASESPVHYNKI